MRGCSGVKREAASLRRTVPSLGRASTPPSLLTGNVIPVDESPATTRSSERRASTRMHPGDPKPNLGFFAKGGNRGKILVAARVRGVLHFPQHFRTTARFLRGKIRRSWPPSKQRWATSRQVGAISGPTSGIRELWAPSVGDFEQRGRRPTTVCALSIARAPAGEVPVGSRPDPVDAPPSTPAANDVGAGKGQLQSQIESDGKRPAS